VAPSLGVELTPVDVRDAGEIERAVTAFARGSNGGLIVTGSALAVVHRELIATLAARHQLPTVYSDRGSIVAGGLIAYGPDRIDQNQSGDLATLAAKALLASLDPSILAKLVELVQEREIFSHAAKTIEGES